MKYLSTVVLLFLLALASCASKGQTGAARGAVAGTPYRPGDRP